MGATQIYSDSIAQVQRNDLDITTTGEAVIRKIVAGTGVSISSTGVDPGTGDVTVNVAGGGGTTVGNRIIYNQNYSASNTFTLAATPTKIYEVRVYNTGTAMNVPVAGYTWTPGSNTVVITDTLQSGDIVYFDVELATLTQTQVNYNRIVSSPTSNITAGSTAYTDYAYFCTGTFTLTMPTAIGNTNRYTVKNTSSGIITLNTTSSQTIEGSLTVPLYSGDSLELLSNNSNWFII